MGMGWMETAREERNGRGGARVGGSVAGCGKKKKKKKKMMMMMMIVNVYRCEEREDIDNK